MIHNIGVLFLNFLIQKHITYLFKMKINYLFLLLFATHFCFGQTTDEKYQEAFYYSEYNEALQHFFDQIVKIKPVQVTGDYDRIMDYTLQSNSDFIVTRIAFRIIGTLPDDNLQKDKIL